MRTRHMADRDQFARIAREQYRIEPDEQQNRVNTRHEQAAVERHDDAEQQDEQVPADRPARRCQPGTNPIGIACDLQRFGLIRIMFSLDRIDDLIGEDADEPIATARNISETLKGKMTLTAMVTTMLATTAANTPLSPEPNQSNHQICSRISSP